MEKNQKSISRPTPFPGVPPQGARRATEGGTPGGGREGLNAVPPDPEVPAQKRRRKLSVQYKLQILQQADKCTNPGEMGALLRREGLYSSSLTRWRRQCDQGLLDAMAPKTRGRKAFEKNPMADELAHLQKENQQLRKKLFQAERIIEVQKKISEILGIDQDPDDRQGSK
ncbi:MAG: hypothetical protein C4519_13895 [Desulfobacteraceae bacterium]|nr:MAG: hypothetical protein C4519_13895 [Desulfobacteraceae bacterium]